MDEEVRCFACKRVYERPVLLPCGHALCSSCATSLQQPFDDAIDVLSVTSANSETDSGVLCSNGSSDSNGSRPGSCIAFAVSCPQCSKPALLDESGAEGLPPYAVMRAVIGARERPPCQMCETQPPSTATVRCERCSVDYCDSCRESCHPSRGALAHHDLAPAGGRPPPSACREHGGAPYVAQCLTCRRSACERCAQLKHGSPSHRVRPLSAACKAQKTELSRNLQLLSEKALALTDHIQRIKKLSDTVNESYAEFERTVSVQCDSLIEAIERRKEALIECVRTDKEDRQRALKEQSNACTRQLQAATGLLQFCIEALKETDGAAFLQVGWMLTGRAANASMTCARALQNAPRPPPSVPDLTLDDAALLTAIANLDFVQMKPPGPPILAPELCAAENNSVTVAWVSPSRSRVEGYVLELDDGHGGDFREVYCGKECMCTVDGLHFNSLYNARVKAFNATGEGPYSELIGLQTAPVAWFCWEGGGRTEGLSLYGQGLGARVAGWEHRVALAGVGLSRGLHYWQLRIDRYDADTDPAFGIARAEVGRDKMLGKDQYGWAMYIDGSRSWFQHGGVHHDRQIGGIRTGSVVGVLLDLDAHTLRFTVDGRPQGGIAFTDLYGVFYPSVSLNRGVSVTLCPALDPPSDFDDL